MRRPGGNSPARSRYSAANLRKYDAFGGTFMEYRVLGRSGLKVSALAMGTMTIGRNKSGPTGSVGLSEAKRLVDQCLDAGVNLIDTANVYARGAVGGDSRRCAEGQARQGGARHQGALQHARPSEHRRQFAHQPDRRVRAQPEAAEDRLDRPLPVAPVGRRDAGRGDDGGARQPRARRGRSATSAARIFPAGTS